jgi:hypothetical protein
MGIHGNKVYRHKDRYYVYFNQYGSEPDGFGLEVLHEIPRNVSKEEFEEWVRKTREYVYAQRDSQVLNDPDDPSNYVVDKQPKKGIFIAWIYEIDLDNLVFHVDNEPLFRLDNMPPDDVFLSAISFDHFGHRAIFECTPVQFRYDWRAPPPTPSPESLVAYNSCHIRSSASSVHDLLDIPVALSSIERLRTTFIELLVTRRMTERSVGHYVRVLESAPDRDHIPQSMLKLALSLVKFAVGPPIYNSLILWLRHRNEINWDFVWIRKDACLRITTHLDDEDNLRSSIGNLVHHINTTQDKVGTIYGVACSIFHCAIVRVDKDPQGTSFAHTPALQFLPSFYARKMSTPGIEALSRLGCQSSGVEFLDIIPDEYGSLYRRRTFATYGKFLVMRGSAAEKVPVEVWTRIGEFISSSSDLVNLASISPEALSAAADLTRYPWVEVPGYRLVKELRLVDVVGSASPIQETTEKTKRKVIRQYYRQLGRAKFTAVVHGRRVTVNLVQDYEYERHVVHRAMSLEIETYSI